MTLPQSGNQELITETKSPWQSAINSGGKTISLEPCLSKIETFLSSTNGLRNYADIKCCKPQSHCGLIQLPVSKTFVSFLNSNRIMYKCEIKSPVTLTGCPKVKVFGPLFFILDDRVAFGIYLQFEVSNSQFVVFRGFSSGP